MASTMVITPSLPREHQDMSRSWSLVIFCRCGERTKAPSDSTLLFYRWSFEILLSEIAARIVLVPSFSNIF